MVFIGHLNILNFRFIMDFDICSPTLGYFECLVSPVFYFHCIKRGVAYTVHTLMRYYSRFYCLNHYAVVNSRLSNIPFSNGFVLD